MAEITRAIVRQRAIDIFPQCGYIWGGWPGTIPQQRCSIGSDGRGYITSGGQYIAADCSGFTSWCWGLGYKRGSWSWSPTGEFGGSNYRARVVPPPGSSDTYQNCFPGIQIGDVLWRDGHTGLYIGNGQVMEASTQQWDKTDTGRGMVYSSVVKPFVGFCSYDGTFSEELTEDEDGEYDEDENVSNGQVGPEPNPTPPGDVSDDTVFGYITGWQYTKRRVDMKHYRRI